GGFRAVDRNLQGEVDGLVSESASAAADNATNQSLIGNYTMTGSQSSNDRLEETGSYPDGTVTRARLTVSDSNEKQRGVLLTFGWTQSVQSHNVNQVNGTVNVASGDYNLTLTSAATNNVLSQTESNQTMSATQTGQT